MAENLKALLQLFAEDGADNSAATGENSGAADRTEAVEEVAVPNRSEEFEKLISGEYKDEFNNRTQKIIGNRLKNVNDKLSEAENFRTSLNPLLEHLADTYGIQDVNDIKALTEKVKGDKSYLENESMRTGKDPDEIFNQNRETREFKSLREKVDELKYQEQQKKWAEERLAEASELKKEFPDFDFDAMLKNEDFKDLIARGKSMKSAYFFVNGESIVNAKAQSVEKKLSQKMNDNPQRPRETATGNPVASNSEFDVNNLSGNEILKILKRVENGEKISFSP